MKLTEKVPECVTVPSSIIVRSGSFLRGALPQILIFKFQPEMRFTTATSLLILTAVAAQIQSSSIEIQKADASPPDIRNLQATRPVSNTRQMRNQLRRLVNQERRQRGLKTYGYSHDINRKAQQWAQYMARTGIFKHGKLTDGVTSTWRRLGENIAMSYTIEGGHNNLMNSPGHRANILSPHFNTIGIGVVKRADGRIYICEVFMEKVFN